MKKNVKYLPKVGHNAHFFPRQEMKKRATRRRFILTEAVPPTPLPVDSTGNASCTCPMDGNDQYGDCGIAMAAHVDNVFTFRQGHGQESTFDVNALVHQYEQVSGGDNGLDEEMVVNQIWKKGIAGEREAIITDALDLDVTNKPLAQYAIDQFCAVCMAWSVPDDFIQNFEQGAVFDSPGRPDPNNGHYTPLADIDAEERYRLWTWGTWCWVSPAFVRSVDPQCFVVFSPRQFDKATGLDSKGRHITQQAALWEKCGGSKIPAGVINAFPPPSPTPAPTPTPAPQPTPTPTPAPLPGAWQWLVTLVEHLLAELGIMALPLIDLLVARLPLPPAIIADLEALIADVLGYKVELRRFKVTPRRAG